MYVPSGYRCPVAEDLELLDRFDDLDGWAASLRAAVGPGGE